MADNGHRDLSAHFTQAYIQTTASGGAPPTYKWVCLGKDWEKHPRMVEMHLMRA